MEAARALAPIKKQTRIPLVADIHFHYELALEALRSGVDCLRLNPGNIRDAEKVRTVVREPRRREVPIRIGVNFGSLPPVGGIGVTRGLSRHTDGVNHLPKGSSGDDEYSVVDHMVATGLWEIGILEDLDFDLIKISLKAFDIDTTVESYRRMADLVPYPFHLGITEAGTARSGSIRSAIGLGALLYEGVGDTIRVSLSDDPREEVTTGFEILKALELRKEGRRPRRLPKLRQGRHRRRQTLQRGRLPAQEDQDPHKGRSHGLRGKRPRRGQGRRCGNSRRSGQGHHIPQGPQGAHRRRGRHAHRPHGRGPQSRGRASGPCPGLAFRPMRVSKLFGKTLRDDPSEAEIASHRLMLRAGLISQVATGVYSYLPLAWRSLRKIEQIIREEMDAAGGQELRLPVLQPVEIWETSGRSAVFGHDMFRVQDRRERPHGHGPHPRGGAHLPRQGQRQQLPRPATHPLPDTDQVPRRAPAQGRPDSRPRVRHEGRL